MSRKHSPGAQGDGLTEIAGRSAADVIRDTPSGSLRGSTATAEADIFAVFSREHVLFPNGYSWLVLAGSLDIIMTYLMLNLGAIEINVIADAALRSAGLWGLIALKFTVVAVVLGICEYIGRQRPGTARKLVGWGVALNLFPVVFSFAQLALFFDDWTAHYMRW